MITDLGTTTQYARKTHRCRSCGGQINAGQKYVRQRQIVDGDPNTFKAHVDCWRASEVVWQSGSCHGEEVCPNVVDFEREDWEHLRRQNPELAGRLPQP